MHALSRGLFYEDVRSSDLFKHIWDTLDPVLLTYGISLAVLMGKV